MKTIIVLLCGIMLGHSTPAETGASAVDHPMQTILHPINGRAFYEKDNKCLALYDHITTLQPHPAAADRYAVENGQKDEFFHVCMKNLSKATIECMLDSQTMSTLLSCNN